MKINIIKNNGMTFSEIKVGEAFKPNYSTEFFIKTDYDKTGKGRAVNLESGHLINVNENQYIEKIYNATFNIEM